MQMNKQCQFNKNIGNKLRSGLLLILAMVIVTGCGFKMRGDYLLPEQFQTLYVTSNDPHGELTRFVKNHLSTNDVNIVKKNRDDIPELRIVKDSLNRRTLSLFENGQVAEYELTYSVGYEIRFKGEEKQRFEFDVTRNYQDDPNRALAKSRELNLLRKEMRIEAADIILRNLASANI